jgi:hypothetical protein
VGEYKNPYKFLAQKLEGKGALARPRHRWDDNIKMNLLKLKSCFVDRFRLIQHKVNCGAFVNMVMNFRVPLSVRNFFTTLANVSASRREELYSLKLFVCSVRTAYC